jgi:hypothetical protein
MQLLCFDSFLLATVPAAAATGAGAATGGGAGAANDQDVSDYTFTPLLTGFKTCTALLCGAIYTLLYKNVITYVLYGGRPYVVCTPQLTIGYRPYTASNHSQTCNCTFAPRREYLNENCVHTDLS